MLTAVCTIDFANTADQALSAAVDLDFPGARMGDIVIIRKAGNSAPEFGKAYVGYVDDTDSLKVYFENNTGGAVNPASANFKVFVIGGEPVGGPL